MLAWFFVLYFHLAQAQQQAPAQQQPAVINPPVLSNQPTYQTDPSDQPLSGQDLTPQKSGVDNSGLPLSDQSLEGNATEGTTSGHLTFPSGGGAGAPPPTKDQILSRKVRDSLLTLDANYAKTVKVDVKNKKIHLRGHVADKAAVDGIVQKVREQNKGMGIVNDLTHD